jgi:hypothetical protein
MELINPKKTNWKRQTRTQPQRDPNEQSGDMNPKKGKEEEVLSQSKATGIGPKNKAIKTQSGQDEVRREEKARRELYKNHTHTILNPHSKSRGGVGRSDREPNLLGAFPAGFGRAVTARCACT